MNSTALALRPVPLTAKAFAPFGSVIEHQGRERRHYLPDVGQHHASTSTPSAWVSRLVHAVSLPLQCKVMERHPHSSQSFIPLTCTPYLVMVAPDLESGLPDMANAQAFIASPNQGVCFRTGAWHMGLSPLVAASQFFVFMHKHDTNLSVDDEFLNLDVAVEILSSSSAT